MTSTIATPLQHNNIRHWLAELAHLMILATRAAGARSTGRQTPKPRRYPAPREAFIEAASMAREMFRL